METATKPQNNNKTKNTNGKMQTGISAKNREQAAKELNELLADEMTLYIKTLKFHWNIEGEGFHALHIFLEEQYNSLQKMIDEVAERVRKIGHFASGSMKQFISDKSLSENEDDRITPDMLTELAHDHDAIIRNVREMISRFEDDYEDDGSADLLTQLLRDHEKMSWMLHSSVK